MKSKAAEIIGIVSVIVALCSAPFMHSVFGMPVRIAGIAGFWFSIYLLYMRLVNACRGNYSNDSQCKEEKRSKAAEITLILSVLMAICAVLFMNSAFGPVMILGIGGSFSGYLFYMRLVNVWRGNYYSDSRRKKIEESKVAEIICVVLVLLMTILSVIAILWSVVLIDSVSVFVPVVILGLIGGSFSGYLFYMRLVNARYYNSDSQNKKKKRSRVAEILLIVSMITILWSVFFIYSPFMTPALTLRFGQIGFGVSLYLFYMRLVNAWRGNYNIDFRKKKIEESKAAEIIGIVSVIITIWSARFMHSVFETPVLILGLIGFGVSLYLLYMRLVNAPGYRNNHQERGQPEG